VVAIVVPVAVRVLRRIGQSIRDRQGHSRASGAFDKAASGLNAAYGRR
jgi:hypothetical protein